jgi:hypothetical protein
VTVRESPIPIAINRNSPRKTQSAIVIKTFRK